jgi:predicted Ser/Thr protein kinase
MMDVPEDSAADSGPRQECGSPADDATVISRSGGSSVSGAPPAISRRSPSAEIGRLLEGSMLGPYRLDAFIGGGGMGAVFRALDTTLDRTVAVKVLARQESDDEETLRRFRNEAQSAARLDHENIGRVHAVGSDGDWHYIVFEFIEGENLRDLIRRDGPWDARRTVEVAIQVAAALEHASQREVVHRDIKPSNIVITPEGRARIVDMGLARFHQVAGDAELTVSGMTLGTFDYISPEQARDPRAADVRSDLYSLGCTMFFMLAGRPPFAEGTMVQKLLQHQQAEPPSIADLRSDVPRRLAAIIGRLMEKDPLDRYQRPAVLVADLLACAEAEGYSITTGPAGLAETRLAAAGPSRLPWVVPSILLLLIVAGLWLRSTAARRSDEDAASADAAAGDSPDGPGSADAGPSPWRVVSSGPDLSAALAELDGDGRVEVDADGLLDVASFATRGRRIAIRAAAGRQPILKVAASEEGAGIRVDGGSLTLEGVAVHLRETGPIEAAGRRLFEIRGGGLSCQGVVLRMPESPSRPAPDPAAVLVSIRDPAFAATDTTLTFSGVRVGGDATLVAVSTSAGGRVRLRWTGGAGLTPGRLLAVDGSRRTGTVIELALADVVIACGDGLVLMRDSAALPLMPRLTATATGCRFVVTDSSQPFVEQAGIGGGADYLAACRWDDRHSRYEGGGVFRRIDAAGERIEQVFGDEDAPMVYDPPAGDLPEPAAWPGWGDDRGPRPSSGKAEEALSIPRVAPR